MKKLLLLIPLGLHLFLLFNLRFTAWPDMFAFPYLINHSFVQYRDFVQPYPPLLPLLLSVLFKVFGYNLNLLKGFTWVLILLNDLLVYSIIKKITNKGSASLFGVFILALTQPFLEGNMLWFDLAIVSPILCGIYFLLSPTPRSLILSGILFTLATLTKQTSGIFLIIAFVYILHTEHAFKKIASFLSGPLILGLLVLLILIYTNSLQDFLNWVLIYPLNYWTKFPGYVQFDLNKNQLLILVFLIFPVVLYLKKVKNVFLLILFVVSLILIYPRFSFFHFQLALTIIALLYGVILSGSKTSKYLVALSVGLVLILTIKQTLKFEWHKETRFYSNQEFQLASLVSKNVKENETVYLLGLLPSNYVFADRVPPKPWVDNYGWYFEMPYEQDKVISSWSTNPPDKIVWQDSAPGNWFDIGTYQPKKVVSWIQQNYKKENEIQSEISLWRKK